MKMKKIRTTRTGRRLVFALAMLFSFGWCLTSCNLSRCVTTKAEFFQRGDTTTTIMTKTIETYDATKK